MKWQSGKWVKQSQAGLALQKNISWFYLISSLWSCIMTVILNKNPSASPEVWGKVIFHTSIGFSENISSIQCPCHSLIPDQTLPGESNVFSNSTLHQKDKVQTTKNYILLFLPLVCKFPRGFFGQFGLICLAYIPLFSLWSSRQKKNVLSMGRDWRHQTETHLTTAPFTVYFKKTILVDR